MKKWFFACFMIHVVAAGSAQAVAITANGLLGGRTIYAINEYENLYDSSGNVVTSRVGQAGDSIQGVFVATQVSNQIGSAFYAPFIAGGVELTGVFDEFVAGTDAAGNSIFTPDSTSVTSGKAISGAAFQATYGSGAMLVLFQNNTDAMPLSINGNGLVGLTSAQAMSLASAGTEWASFGANGVWVPAMATISVRPHSPPASAALQLRWEL